jgi:hypothetical protein
MGVTVVSVSFVHILQGIKGIRSFNHRERALQGGFASEKWILVAVAFSKDGIITA